MHETQPTPLYKRLLGVRYNVLPKAVQELHNLTDRASYKGVCTVKRGNNPFARFIAWLLSMPREGHSVDVTVDFSLQSGVEHWSRKFNGQGTYSRQYIKDDFLYEDIGATTLVFSVISTPDKLALRLEQVYLRLGFLRIPTPTFLHPKIIAEETDQEDRFNFHVSASMPLIGFVVSYRGWLSPVSEPIST